MRAPAAGTSDGSQTSQHGTDGAGAAASPKWRRMPSRRHPPPSTHAQTARYWRQRIRVPSSAAERQTASDTRSHVPMTRPTIRSGADGAGWITPARAM